MAKSNELAELRSFIAPYLTDWLETSKDANAAFRNWAVEQILWDEDLSTDQIETITQIDKPGELGIDAWYYSRESDPPTLHLIQVKNSKAKPKDLAWLREGFLSLFGSGAEIANTDAKLLAQEFSSHPAPGTVIEFHIALNEFATDALRAQARQMQGVVKILEGEIPCRAVVHDLRDLTRELRVTRTPEIAVSVDVPKSSYFEMWTTGKYKTVAAAVPGLFLANAFRDHRTQLFRLNPRYYLSARGSVNQGMLATLRSADRKNFYLYNNGVTAVCSGVHVEDQGDSARVTVSNFQIVNGCQTTATLYRAWEQGAGDAELDGVEVLLRIIESPSEQIAHQIRERTNKQNPMKAEDDKANDPVQEALHKAFNKLTEPWFYEHKRGVWVTDFGRQADRLPYAREGGGWRHLTMKDLAQASLAFLGHPAWAVEGPRFVFQDEERYHRVFPEKVQPQQLLLGYLLFEQASALLNGTETELKSASYLRYPLVSATAAVLRDWLGLKEARYLPPGDAMTLCETVTDWGPEVMKVALKHLIAVAKASDVGTRSLVRQSGWIEEPTAALVDALRDRLTVEKELAHSMNADPQNAGLRAKFPLLIRD